MDIKKITITIGLLFMILFLIFVNIGLNISGPARLEEIKVQEILERVNSRFPLVHSLYQHNFRYTTYSAIVKNEAFVFDYEGVLIMRKDFDESMIEEIKSIVKEDYGIEEVDVQIGFGYNNMVFVVEKDDQIICFDYDTKEVVYYMKGNLV